MFKKYTGEQLEDIPHSKQFKQLFEGVVTERQLSLGRSGPGELTKGT